MYQLSTISCKVYIVCGIYLACAVVGILIVTFLLDSIKLDKESDVEDRKLSPKLLIATFKHLVSSPAQMLLIPLTVYSGVEQAFIGGDFTQVISTGFCGPSEMLCYL